MRERKHKRPATIAQWGDFVLWKEARDLRSSPQARLKRGKGRTFKLERMGNSLKKATETLPLLVLQEKEKGHVLNQKRGK